MPRLPAALLTTLLLGSLALAGATLLPGQRWIVRRRQRTVRRIALEQAIMLIDPLPQRRDLRQEAEHQLNRRFPARARDPFRIRNPHERKIPCDLKESSRSPRPYVNAYRSAAVRDRPPHMSASRCFGRLTRGHQNASVCGERPRPPITVSGANLSQPIGASSLRAGV